MTRSPDLKQGITRIRAALSRWRRLNAIRDRLKGGVYQIECNPKGDGWHVHLHILADCTYLPKSMLWRTWARALGQKTASVDVTSADARKAKKYAVKYAVKPCDLDHWTPHQLAEFVKATHRQRQTHTFGTWHGVLPSDWLDEPPKQHMICPRCLRPNCVQPWRAGASYFGADWPAVRNTIRGNLPELAEIPEMIDLLATVQAQTEPPDEPDF
jgi:hypothetical protein